MKHYINNFKGMTPRVNAKLLPDNLAQTAKNCDLREGTLKALKSLNTAATFTDPGALRSLYRYDPSTTYYIYWTDADISALRLQLAASSDRVMYTGDGYPKQFDSTLMAAAGIPADTSDYRKVGIAAPSAALTTGLLGTSDSVVKYSAFWVYTYVVKWSDGTEEESPPSPATAILDVDGGEYVSLTNFVIPTLVATGNNITHVRVYRRSATTTGADIRLIKSRGTSATEATDFWYDIPVAKVPTTATAIYDSNGDGGDLDLWDNSADDLLETTDWDNPPTTLAGLIQYQNGILAGFSGRYVYVSEPFVHYAWPTNNRIPVDYDIVALGVHNLSMIVTTTAYPYVVWGSDSTTLSSKKLAYKQKNLSARGLVSTEYGVVYPCPDGLFMINDDGGTLITDGVITKTQWEALGTLSNLVGFFYDNKYIGIFAGTGNGFVLNFKESYWLKEFTLDKTVYHGLIAETDDDLILLTNAGGDDYYADEFERSTSSLTFKWKSKKFETPPASMAAGKVEGGQSATSPLIFIPYGDGVQLQRKKVETSELPSNLVGYWDMDGDVEDESDESNDGTLTGCSWGQGVKGYSLKFDYTADDKCTVADDAVFDFGVTDFAMCCFVKINAYRAQGGLGNAIFYRGAISATAGCQYGLIIDSSGYPKFIAGDADQAAIYNTSIADGRFHFVVGIRASGVLKIYVDLVAGTDGNHAALDIDGAEVLTFGGDTSATCHLDGSICEARLYSDLITVAQMTALYNSLWFKEVTDKKMFRLPGVKQFESHEYAVLGDTEVESITAATSPEELQVLI